MKVIWRTAAFLFFWVCGSLLVLSACSGRVVEELPDADIVFQSSWNSTDPGTLGFIDADGSDLTYVQVSRLKKVPVCPSWTPNGDYLLFRGAYDRYCFGNLYAIGPDKRLVSYRQEVAFGKNTAAIIAGGEYFVIHEAGDAGGIEHLYLLDVEGGEIEDTYVTESKSRAGVEIGTNALNGSLLVYAYTELVDNQTRASLTLRSMDTGEETVLVKAEGIIQPSISPDGNWVVYTAQDGIYLISVVGGEPREIVATAVRRESSLGLRWDWSPPVASWSPDSRWLVYHRCTLPGFQYCYQPSHYSIFKVNIETGEEVLLVEQGLNPYWRLKNE